MAQFRDPNVHFKWNNHLGDLVRKFHFLLEEKVLVDVTLTAGGQSLKAHRLILAASSQYFEDLFSLPQSDDSSALAEINLSGQIQFEDLQVLVDYMYRGEISVPWHQLPSLLEAASQLEIRDNSIGHGQAQEMLFNRDKSSDSMDPLQLQFTHEFESIGSRSEVDAARFNQLETGLMDDGKGGYCNVTFVEPCDQQQFSGLLETVGGDPLPPIQDDDSTSDTSADRTIDPGWDDGVLPLTRAQFLEAKAEYLAKKNSVALETNEDQEYEDQIEERMEESDVSEYIEPDDTDHLSPRDDDDGDAYSSAADSDAGQYEERMEESDVSEHIEPNQKDYLSSRDNDYGDASSSAADYEEEEKEEEDEEYEDASAVKSRQSSFENGSDDSTYDEDFNSNSSAAGPSKRKRESSAKPSSKQYNRHLKKKGPVECRNCGKSFKINGATCKRHMELCGVVEPRTFPCQMCEKKYSRKHYLQRHLIEVHRIEPSQLANYGAGSRNKAANPDSTARSSNSSLSFACKSCGLSYKSEESYRRHLEFECKNDGPSYHCSQCDYWSKRLENLNNHVKLHVGGINLS